MGEIDELKEILKDTFSKIKEDITSNSKNIEKLSDNLDKLIKESKAMKKQIQEMQDNVDSIKSLKPVVKKIVPSKKIDEVSEENTALKQSLAKIETKVRSLAASIKSSSGEDRLDLDHVKEIIEDRFNSLPPKLSVSAGPDHLDESAIKKIIDEKIGSLQLTKPDQKKQALRDDVLRQFDKKRKDIIKHKILELISASQMTLSEIKEVIVDQNSYCSKASFYRYIERMKLRQQIDFVEINGIALIVPFKKELRPK